MAPTEEEEFATIQALFERGVVALEENAGAMNRIAAVLERFEPAEPLVCEHPEEDREVHQDSTMSNVRYRCKKCEQEVEVKA